MATEASFMDWVHEQSQLGPALVHRKMFGEYALYLQGKVVAFACDNSLYIKSTAALAAIFPEAPMDPAYPGSKDYAIADAVLDEPERLQALWLATAECLPSPKPKPAPKKTAPSSDTTTAKPRKSR